MAMIPCRPPTPPRTSLHSTTDKDVILSDAQPILDTPTYSPTSSIGTGTPGSVRSERRVGFCPWPAYHKAPAFSKTKPSNLQIRTLPPSNACKPSKSILKSSTYHIETTDSNSEQTFADMLESIVQQLAGDSRSSRIDAYTLLLHTMKAYKGVPDREAMLEKMDLLCQFIRRDITGQPAEPDTMDFNLVRQALTLLAFFLWEPNLANSLTDDFRTFILDRSTNALSDPATKKAHLTHYMHVLASQKFSHKIMTNDRGTKIVTSLQDITDRVSGHAVVAQRLVIYQRLLGQVRPVMVARIKDWMEHLLSGLFVSIKDIRLKAISFGTTAAVALGTSVTVSTSVCTLLEEKADEKQLVTELSQRLNRMAASKEDGMYVPQIWSVIILFLRNRPGSLERWGYFKDWMSIIQKCFNSSDPLTKFEANLAWNRFVYAVAGEKPIGSMMRRMLIKPIVSHLDRYEKLGKQLKQVTLSSYCNLLYYCLRPTSTKEQLDQYWLEYVIAPIKSSCPSNPGYANRAARIVAELLWSTQPKPWAEDRAIESHPLEPEELPPLDCKWIRSRSAGVLQSIEPLFKCSDWGLAHPSAAEVSTTWRNFTRSLAEASSKEIKPSKDTMKSLGNALATLRRVWSKRPRSLNTDNCEIFRLRYQYLILCLLSSLGPIPFTEAFLSESPEGYTVSQTPSQNASRPAERRPPFHLLIRFLAGGDIEKDEQAAYKDLLSAIFTNITQAKGSRGSLLELYRQIMDDLVRGKDQEIHAVPLRVVWSTVSVLAQDLLIVQSSGTSSSDSYPSSSRDYSNVVKILATGPILGIKIAQWNDLLTALTSAAMRECGHDSLEPLVIEPLSKHLAMYDSIEFSTAFLRAISILTGHHGYRTASITSAHLAPLPHSTNPTKISTNFVDMINYHLLQNYEPGLCGRSAETRGASLKKHDNDFLAFMDGITLFLQYVDSAFILHKLPLLQSGIGRWLEDGDRLLKHKDAFGRILMSSVSALSSAVATSLILLPSYGTEELRLYEMLLVSAFRSCHRSILARYIQLWNDTFGKQDELEYPPSVKVALLQLRSTTDLLLPGLLEDAFDEVEPETVEYVSSQDDGAEDLRTVDPGRHRRFLSPYTASSSPVHLISSPRNNQGAGASSSLQKPSSAMTTPKRRLRHEDSQVEFITIDSSPPRVTEPDSQHLTDRQKEVRARQHEDAGLFPNLASSPLGDKSEVQQQDPALPTRQGAAVPTTVDEGPATPLFSGNGAEEEDDFIISSPTPRSKDPRLQIEDLDLPSSPPLRPRSDLRKEGEIPSSPPPNLKELEGRVGSSEFEPAQNSNAFDLQQEPAVIDMEDADDEPPAKFTEENHPGETEIITGDTSLSKNGAETEEHNPQSDPYSDDAEEQLASQLEHDVERASSFEQHIEVVSPIDEYTKEIDVLQYEEDGIAVSDLESGSDPGDIEAMTLTQSKKKRKRSTSSTKQPPKQITKRRSARLSQQSIEPDASTLDPEKPLHPTVQTIERCPTEESDVAQPTAVTDSTSKTRGRPETCKPSGINAEISVQQESQGRRRSARLNTSSRSPELRAKDQVEPKPATSDLSAEADMDTVMQIDETVLDEVAAPATTEDHDIEVPDVEVPEAPATNDDDNMPEPAIDTGNSAPGQDDVPTEAGLLASLRGILGNLKKSTIGKAALREMDDIMFDIRVEAYEAAKRGNVD